MNQQNFIDSVNATTLSDEVKNKIISLINEKGFDFSTREEIKDIIQAELDNEFASDVLKEEDKLIINEENAQLSISLQEVENDMEKDMEFVESEMNNLKKIVKELDQMVDEDKIDDLKAQIENS